jgi:hypothetical protein
MQKIPLDQVYRTAERLESLRLHLETQFEGVKKSHVPEEARKELSDIMLSSDMQSARFGAVFKFTQILCQEFSDRVRNESDQLRFEEIGLFIAKMSERVRHELSLMAVYEIQPNRVDYYNKSAELFGAAVSAAFPSSRDDIEEAGRCLAVGRSTACVFHLMRAITPVLKAIASELGYNEQRDWGKYLSEMKGGIWRKFPDDKTKANDSQREFYSDLESRLRSYKEAWRNPTMHDPEKIYTEEKAGEIFDCVKGFMRKAAERLKD